MRIEIAFTNDEAARILWLLRQRYGSGRAGLKTLAKQAIRELVAQQAVVQLADLEKE